MFNSKMYNLERETEQEYQKIDMDFVKDKLIEKREQNQKEDLLKIDQLDDNYTSDQKEAIRKAVGKGCPFSVVANPEYEALKIEALGEAYEAGATVSILETMKNMNFMQIKWCIIPAMKREDQVIEENKNYREIDLNKNRVQPVNADTLCKQMMILKYMYQSLISGESYTLKIEKDTKKGRLVDCSERFLITFSGKDGYNGHYVRRVMFSHGIQNEVKPLMIFSIDNKKNKYGSFKMYSTHEEKNRELDLNAEELSFIYSSMEHIEKRQSIKSLDEEICMAQKSIQQEKQEEQARREAYAKRYTRKF